MSKESDDMMAIFQSLDNTSVIREGYEKCPISYPGSKRRSIPNLLSYLPYTDTWIDVFGGSGVVTLARHKSKFEVFNDKHSGITSFYRCIRDKDLKDQLLRRLDLTVHSREDFIWSLETWEHDLLDNVERAARWYYSLIYSFGTAGRNFGRAITSKMVFAGKLREKLVYFDDIHDRFKAVQIENLDWRHILKDYDSTESVMYIDPPYISTNINKKYDMSRTDHIELCERIFDCSGFVALSGYDNDIYNKYPWDRKESWDVRVSMTTKENADNIGKSSAEECLWIKEFK